MKQEVRISYSSKGLRPPVYLVSSLTDPQWEPTELSFILKPDGDYEFFKLFQAEEGEYQYKFRLGPGDWWALDESKPIVDDGDGNRNNTIKIVSMKEADGQEIKAGSVSVTPARALPDNPPPVPPRDNSATVLNGPLKLAAPLQEGISNAFSNNSGTTQHPAILGPSPPLTPPLTPHMTSSADEKTSQFRTFEGAASEPRDLPASRSSKIDSAHAQQNNKSTDNSCPIIPEEAPQGIIAAFKVFIVSFGSWLVTALGGGRITGALAVVVGLAAVAYRIRDTAGEALPAIFSYLPFNGKRNNSTD